MLLRGGATKFKEFGWGSLNALERGGWWMRFSMAECGREGVLNQGAKGERGRCRDQNEKGTKGCSSSVCGRRGSVRCRKRKKEGVKWGKRARSESGGVSLGKERKRRGEETEKGGISSDARDNVSFLKY